MVAGSGGGGGARGVVQEENTCHERHIFKYLNLSVCAYPTNQGNNWS